MQRRATQYAVTSAYWLFPHRRVLYRHHLLDSLWLSSDAEELADLP